MDEQQRMASRPDTWTLAWWRQQMGEVVQGYRGATHAINRAIAELEDLAVLRERCERLEQEAAKDRAKIGELQERVERMAEYLNHQRGKEGGER